MNFKDIKIDSLEKFSIGIEEESGRYYLSIPVSNNFVDYEEFYVLETEQFDSYLHDMSKTLTFVKKCRNREMDNLILIKPGKNRGIAM